MKKIMLQIAVLIYVSSIGASPLDDLGKQIEEKANLAVSQFQERAGGKLNYSPESLSIIEEMLNEASEFYDELPKDQIESLCHLMGSYILYVGYKEHGGKFHWSEEKNQPVLVVGEPKFKVAIMTFDKVRGRLSGDKADNIPFFYKGFSDRVRNAEKGTDALYL